MWIFKNEKVLYFVGGLVAAAVGSKAVKSGKARELGVKGLAAGMVLQKKAQEAFINMKEDATDMCHDAAERSGRCSCDCDKEKNEV